MDNLQTSSFHVMPPKLPLTHFLCLPLVSASSRTQLQSSLARFAADVSQPGANGEPKVPSRAVRPVGALHLTIGMMSLQTPERIEQACTFLKELDVRGLLRTAAAEPPNGTPKSASTAPRPESPSTSPNQPLASLLPQDLSPALVPMDAEPLVIALTSLSPMQSLTSTSSLYASPLPLHPILPFAQRLHDAFLAGGFLLPPPGNRSLKLHATLVNTIYVKKTAGGKSRWGKGSAKIDAREVIKRWGETTWAEDVRMEKVAICKMGAKKVMDAEGKIVDEVYQEVASMELP